MPSSLRSEADQNGFILDLYALVPRFARDKVAHQDIEDVVHDITTECLIRLRAGNWLEAPENLQAFVRALVKYQTVSRRRKFKWRGEFDHEHLRARSATPPEWVSPDPSSHEAFIKEFKHASLSKLSDRARMAYHLVRERGATYDAAAEQVGVSPATVHQYISKAHRQLRADLELLGLRVPCSDVGGRPRSGKRRWKRPNVAFRYPAPASAATRRKTNAND